MKTYVYVVLLFNFLTFTNIAFGATVNLLPVDDGHYLEWQTSTSTQHFSLVDDTVCNGTTDYVFTPASTSSTPFDSYKLDITSIPFTAKVTDISIVPCASRNNSLVGTSTLDVFYRLNGVNSAFGGNYNITGLTPINLATTSLRASFFPNATTTLEIGVKHSGTGSATSTPGVRLSRLMAVITYSIFGSH